MAGLRRRAQQAVHQPAPRILGRRRAIEQAAHRDIVGQRRLCERRSAPELEALRSRIDREAGGLQAARAVEHGIIDGIELLGNDLARVQIDQARACRRGGRCGGFCDSCRPHAGSDPGCVCRDRPAASSRHRERPTPHRASGAILARDRDERLGRHEHPGAGPAHDRRRPDRLDIEAEQLRRENRPRSGSRRRSPGFVPMPALVSRWPRGILKPPRVA